MNTKTPAEKKLISLMIIFPALLFANFSTNGLKRLGENLWGKGWGDILQGGFGLLGLIIFAILAFSIKKKIKLEKEKQNRK